jgi:flagellar basal-body rod protein FlgC
MAGIDPIQGAMGAASSGMKLESHRLRLSAENLSNVDTPGYQRKLMFAREMAEGGAEVARTGLSPKEGREHYDPYHPLADERGMVRLSNVDLMVELADAREARRSFDANVQAFKQAQSFYRGLLDLLQR